MDQRPRKYLGISTIRSDYDLLSGVYAALDGRADAEFRLLVGGSHLSSTFGRTVRFVEEDGLDILGRIECLIDGDTPSSRAKTAAGFMQSATDFIASYGPDVVLYAGDREDALMTAAACTYMQIPTVHFFGGDHARDGHMDNPVRHAISKLSTFHFVVHERHHERLLALGEDAHRIHVIGSPALDKYRQEPGISRADVLHALAGEDAGDVPERYAVVIYHPSQRDDVDDGAVAGMLLDVLRGLGLHAFVSWPNTDAGNRDVLQAYRAAEAHGGLTPYGSLPRSLFVNLLRHADVVVGNSSLGLLESPSVPVPAVDVGSRQRGRLAAENVLSAAPERAAVERAVREATSPSFRERTARVQNPYGDGRSVEHAVDLLLSLDYGRWLRKREDPLPAAASVTGA